METTIIVSSKGQVVIPKKIRHEIGIHAGTELLLNYDKGDNTLHLSLPQKDITDFFSMGCHKKGSKKTNVDEDIAKAVQEDDQF